MALLDSRQLNPRLTGSFTISGSLIGDTSSTGSFGELNVFGNSSILGDLTLGGDIQIGDSTGDSITITADFTSNLIPNVDNTFDLGSSVKNWRVGYIEQIVGETVTTTGNISGSATSTGSFGRSEITDNISIGGDILLDEDQRIYFEADKQTWMEANGANLVRIVTNNSQMLLLDHETGNRAVFGNGTKVFIGANNNELPSNELEVVGTISGSGILSIDGNITGSGNLEIAGNISGSAASTGSFGELEVDTNATVDGDVKVAQYIKHKGNETTFINFTDNRIRFKAGDIGFLDMEKDASTPYPLTVNQGGNRVNFRVVDRNTDLLLKTDSEEFNVKLYYAGNEKLLTKSDGVEVLGNVSGSATSTGSFGTLETVGEINASGRIFESGTSVIDHATAMAIVFGG